MEPESGSYGTGRDPRRKNSYLIPIIFLLLSSIAIHGVTLLYLRTQKELSQEDPNPLLLEELPARSHSYQEPIKDKCGFGLELSDISEIQQRYWSLPDGAYIEQVETDSIAYRAGLRSGDLLVQIGDRKIVDASSCMEILEEYCKQPSLYLVYYRDGTEHHLRISLSDAR